MQSVNVFFYHRKQSFIYHCQDSVQTSRDSQMDMQYAYSYQKD